MKDLSKIIKSKEYEHEFWKIIAETFIDNDEISSILACKPNQNDEIKLVLVSDLPREWIEDNEILFFGFRYDNEPDFHCIKKVILGEINPYEIEQIKNGKVFNLKYEDVVELTVDDVPDIYKVLG